MAAAKKDSGKRRSRAVYETAEELQKVVDKYFAQCEESGEVPSEAGLALAAKVGVPALQSWYDGRKCPYLQETAQDAYSRMTSIYMQLLLTGNKNMTPFVIFMLKQQRFAGYQDKVESKQDIAVNVKMGEGVEASDFA